MSAAAALAGPLTRPEMVEMAWKAVNLADKSFQALRKVSEFLQKPLTIIREELLLDGPPTAEDINASVDIIANALDDLRILVRHFHMTELPRLKLYDQQNSVACQLARTSTANVAVFMGAAATSTDRVLLDVVREISCDKLFTDFVHGNQMTEPYATALLSILYKTMEFVLNQGFPIMVRGLDEVVEKRRNNAGIGYTWNVESITGDTQN